jgi:hypothetical protein
MRSLRCAPGHHGAPRQSAAIRRNLPFASACRAQSSPYARCRDGAGSSHRPVCRVFPGARQARLARRQVLPEAASSSNPAVGQTIEQVHGGRHPVRVPRQLGGHGVLIVKGGQIYLPDVRSRLRFMRLSFRPSVDQASLWAEASLMQGRRRGLFAGIEVAVANKPGDD